MLRNVRVMMIPIVIGALETVSKDLEKRLKELKIRRIETLQPNSLEETYYQ